ncbi:MAG: TfoX/Sxy family protein [Clostridia bacterium]|nr:TfoX/Sxy family protein [Clostridia bacterium]
MASSLEFVQYACDQMSDAGIIDYKKMFGEYSIYCDSKIIGLICDDCLYIKPTQVGRSILKEVIEAEPYKGAKPYFLIENLEDKETLVKLVKKSCEVLSMQKKRK